MVLKSQTITVLELLYRFLCDKQLAIKGVGASGYELKKEDECFKQWFLACLRSFWPDTPDDAMPENYYLRTNQSSLFAMQFKLFLENIVSTNDSTLLAMLKDLYHPILVRNQFMLIGLLGTIIPGPGCNFRAKTKCVIVLGGNDVNDTKIIPFSTLKDISGSIKGTEVTDFPVGLLKKSVKVTCLTVSTCLEPLEEKSAALSWGGGSILPKKNSARAKGNDREEEPDSDYDPDSRDCDPEDDGTQWVRGPGSGVGGGGVSDGESASDEDGGSRAKTRKKDGYEQPRKKKRSFLHALTSAQKKALEEFKALPRDVLDGVVKTLSPNPTTKKPSDNLRPEFRDAIETHMRTSGQDNSDTETMMHCALQILLGLKAQDNGNFEKVAELAGLAKVAPKKTRSGQEPPPDEVFRCMISRSYTEVRDLLKDLKRDRDAEVQGAGETLVPYDMDSLTLPPEMLTMKEDCDFGDTYKAMFKDICDVLCHPLLILKFMEAVVKHDTAHPGPLRFPVRASLALQEVKLDFRLALHYTEFIPSGGYFDVCSRTFKKFGETDGFRHVCPEELRNYHIAERVRFFGDGIPPCCVEYLAYNQVKKHGLFPRFKEGFQELAAVIQWNERNPQVDISPHDKINFKYSSVMTAIVVKTEPV